MRSVAGPRPAEWGSLCSQHAARPVFRRLREPGKLGGYKESFIMNLCKVGVNPDAETVGTGVA